VKRNRWVLGVAQRFNCDVNLFIVRVEALQMALCFFHELY
jgi:hypothetical protein